MLPTLIIPAPTQWVPLQPNCTSSGGNNVIFGVGKMDSASDFMSPSSLLPVLLTENKIKKSIIAEDNLNINNDCESVETGSLLERFKDLSNKIFFLKKN